MPSTGKEIKVFPKQIGGQYLSLGYDSTTVWGNFYLIKKQNENYIEVHSTVVLLVDSAKFIEFKLGSIDSVWFENNFIQIKHGKSLKKLSITDTIRIENEQLEMIINLDKDSYCIENDSLPCNILFSNNAYYINVENQYGDYQITRFQLDESDILVNQFKFLLGGPPKNRENIISKYKILLAQRQYRGSGFAKDYLAKLSDEQFFQLVNEKSVFSKFRLYKLGEKDGNYFSPVLLGFSIVLLLILVMGFKKVKIKSQNTKEVDY